MSEAGVIILPSTHDGHEGESMEDPDVLEPEAALLKRPSKPGIPRSELFDPEDSWYDEPPEGFSLTVSHFKFSYHYVLFLVQIYVTNAFNVC